MPVGSAVTWTYNVTNTGTGVALSTDVKSVTDDNVAPVNPADVASPSASMSAVATLDAACLENGETWVFTATGGTLIAGQYGNIGTLPPAHR